jgi:hypothetical protein
MRLIISSIFFLGFIYLIAYITNPSSNRIKKDVENRMRTALQKPLQENFKNEENYDKEYGVFNNTFTENEVHRIINNEIQLQNLKIFTLIKTSHNNKDRVIGIAMFAYVITFPNELIKLKKNLPKNNQQN